jgi:hypothetical protein
MPSERCSLDGKPTFHSQSGRDAFDHVKINDGMGTSQQLSEWQHVSVCKSRNQADSLEGRDGVVGMDDESVRVAGDNRPEGGRWERTRF